MMLQNQRARIDSRLPFKLNTALKPVVLATLLTLSHHAFAESPNAEIKLDLDAIPVTGNPLGVSSDELVVPVSVLNGRELSLQREPTIGATLSNIPGVTATQFGPNVSRPMIRGLDADRVRIMQNGVGVLDVSSVSGDHAVAIDPLVVEQIDVVRGPAALLYGGNAMGGAVNAIDHRIPAEAVDGFLGRAETRFGGPADMRSGAAVIDLGTERFTLHVDGFYRKTNDLDIPGYNISNNKFYQEDDDHDEHEEDHDDDHDETTERTKGKLANSDGKQYGGAIGGSIHFDNGYIGTSYSVLDNNYGVVAFDDVRLDLKSKRWDIASEFFDLGGWINRTKVKLAYTDYEHKELEGSEVGTTFDTKGWQGTFEAGHAPIGKLNGVVGYQFADTEFSAVGEEAFVPSTETQSHAVYVYEELPINAHKITFGARFGNVNVDSKTTEGFDGTGQDKRFNPNSFAIGGVYQINDQWSFATNISHNERAPSHFELYADGVHIATAQFEIGDPDLKTERSNGIDAQFRWKAGQHNFNVSAYYTDFDNFIGLFDTGVEYEEDHDEEEEGHEEHGHGDQHTTIANFRAVPARFKGIEFSGQYQATSTLAIKVRGDYVHAKETDNDTYLPRIAPVRLGLGANYQKGRFNARFDVLHAFDQNRTAENELETDGYTNVTALVAYQLPTKYNIELFARANNLLDDEIRDHASFLKDIAPAGSRSLVVGARADF